MRRFSLIPHLSLLFLWTFSILSLASSCFAQDVRGESSFIVPSWLPFFVPPEPEDPIFPECEADIPECQDACNECVADCADSENQEMCEVRCLAAWAVCIHPIEFKFRCIDYSIPPEALPDDIPGSVSPIQISPLIEDRNPGTGNPFMVFGVRCTISF